VPYLQADAYPCLAAAEKGVVVGVSPTSGRRKEWAQVRVCAAGWEAGRDSRGRAGYYLKSPPARAAG
jgi:hypothetical protein